MDPMQIKKDLLFKEAHYDSTLFSIYFFYQQINPVYDYVNIKKLSHRAKKTGYEIS